MKSAAKPGSGKRRWNGQTIETRGEHGPAVAPAGEIRPEGQPTRSQAAFAEWLDMRALTEYACISERTIGSWLRLPVDPLPAVQVDRKILVSRRDFDLWLKRHPLKSAVSVNIGAIVDEIVEGIRKS